MDNEVIKKYLSRPDGIIFLDPLIASFRKPDIKKRPFKRVSNRKPLRRDRMKIDNCNQS